MLVGKPDLRRLIPGLIAALWVAQPAAFELVDVSGSVGYTYRAITGSTSSDASSNQLRGAVNAQSYLWQPWFATLTAGLRFTQDATDYEGAGTSTDTSILTGDFDLNVLSQSKTPFSLTYQTSDSRVDTVSLPNTVTTLGGREFTTRRLALRQSYFNDRGDRFLGRYDRNTWETRGGEDYLDQLVGLEMNVRRPRHTLSAKTTYQEIERNVLDQRTDNFVVNVDHYYHPHRAFRVDSMLSHFDSESASTQPLNSTNLGDSTMDLTQLSSFLFYRPLDRPLSMSAGVRVFGLNAENAGTQLEQTSVSAMSGLFYQMTKNLRLDANVEGTAIDNDERTQSSRQRVGALYQSDLREIFARMTWNWYTSASVQHQDLDEVDILTSTLRIGHDAQRLWLTQGRGTFRLSLSQSVSGIEQSGDADLGTQRIDHSGSFSWDRYSEGATTMFQVTLSDSRGYGDQEDEQQFANVQFMRTQTLSLRSQLSGNLTVQYMRRDFIGMRDDDTVAATGQVNFQHMDLFNIAQLRFHSDLRISHAAMDEGLDRAEWENRLSYAIGLLDTSASWRYINLDNEEKYSLVYFQVNRRF
jgi:hypothetical protein